MATRLHSRTGGQLTPSFVRASEIPERKSRLVTGYPALDNLIGEMEGGQTYLFCGYSGSPFVDELINRLMVKASHRGKVAYLNSTDYYSEKTLISADRLAFYAKVEALTGVVRPERVRRFVQASAKASAKVTRSIYT